MAVVSGDDAGSGEYLDRLPRAELGDTELGPMPAVVASVLDEWLFTQHGILSGHHGVGVFLDLLAADGYRVTAIGAPRFEDVMAPSPD